MNNSANTADGVQVNVYMKHGGGQEGLTELLYNLARMEQLWGEGCQYDSILVKA